MVGLADKLYEQVLLLRLQPGDEHVLSELMARYQARLRYYLYRMLNDTNSSEDLFQDIWLDVYCGIAQLKDPAAFRTWLYRIAHAKVCRELRNRHRFVQLQNEAHVVDNDRYEQTFTAEDAEQIHLALGCLTHEYREVLVFRFVEGMSYEDIAQLIGRPLGTVKSRLYYAKQTLRRIIERSHDHV